MKDIREILNKRVDKLEARVEFLSKYKELFDWVTQKNRQLEEQLNKKRNVIRVIVKRGDNNHILQLTEVIDTPDGLFIEGEIR